MAIHKNTKKKICSSVEPSNLRSDDEIIYKAQKNTILNNHRGNANANYGSVDATDQTVAEAGLAPGSVTRVLPLELEKADED